jgi:hypothetical protein
VNSGAFCPTAKLIVRSSSRKVDKFRHVFYRIRA